MRYQRDMTSPYPYMIPSLKHFTDSMKFYGIKPTTRVVLYDTKPGQGYSTSRVYWIFKVFGHKNVSILNGGFKKWVSEGRKTESSATVGTDDDYKYEFNPSIYRTFEQIVEYES